MSSDVSADVGEDVGPDSSVLVSVVVPCYNVANYLQQCLTSIREQTEERLEIICVNDGSTDDTLQILQSNAAKDQRIKIINKQNAGYGAACNDGIEAATGQWISIVEPDDWIELGMYFAMMIIFLTVREDQTGRIDIVKTPYWRIWMPDTDKQRKINCSYRGCINPPKQPFRIEEAPVLLSDHPSIWSAIYRREFLDQFNIRFEELPGAGWTDNHFLVRTLCQARNILYLDVPFYCYREDTPEKELEFTKRNTLLPIDRWLEMLDIIENLGITDRRILEAHYVRGFFYVAGIIEVISLSDPTINAAVKTVFERMDPDIVFDALSLSPDKKRFFNKMRGFEDREFDQKAYRKQQIKSGLRNLRNTGVKNTWHRLSEHIKKNDTRTGKE